MKRYLLISICLILGIAGYAQAYEIPVKVKNLTDSMIYLGHHFGNGYFVVDSANLDKNGETTFKGDEKLKGGIYFLFLPGSKYFDFLIDNDQKFSISCDTADFINSVKFENSIQNQRFFSYQKYINQQHRNIAGLREKQKGYITKMDTLMMIENQIQRIYNQIYLLKEETIAKDPDSLVSVLIKASIPIIPPPAPRDTAGNVIDSLYEYRYVKNHFFDNIDFADERLLQTTIIQNKVLEYLTRIVPQDIDSVKTAIDVVVSKAAANSEVYKFVLNSLFQFYNKSRIITDENLFVYIAENYYLAGKTPWTNEKLDEKLRIDINAKKPSLIGATAKEFTMEDNNGKDVSLSNIQNKHVILYFYDTDCEVCKEVSPELRNFYRIIKDRGVDVIGIYTGEDKKKWLEYIEANNLNWTNVWDPKNKSGFRENYRILGTPQIFLLDEDQKIIAKRITVEQLMGYFNAID